MASETSLLIVIGSAVGSAVAGIGSVDAGVQRLGKSVEGLQRRKDAIGGDFVGPRTADSLARANAEAVKLGRAMDQLKAKQSALAENKQIGDALRQQRQELKGEALGLGAAIATMAAPVKLSMDFESAMADVRKVVDFDTPAGLSKLGDELLRMSRTIPLTAVALAAITASGGQLGIAVKDLPMFTETVAKMSTAFDMMPEDAGDSMAKLANVYQIPITQIGRLGDAINQLSNESPAKARDIVLSLGRVGGVAKQFGLSELQAASLSNAFISLGKTPEVAGTAINGMLVKLQTADKQGVKFQGALRAMGLSAASLKRAIAQDAEGALLGFLRTMERIPASERMGLLVDLFGLEYADDVSVLVGSVKTYTDSIASLKKTGADGKPAFLGSMEREFAARAATTSNNLTLFKSSLFELGITIGTVVLPAMNDLLNDIKPLVYSAVQWAGENKELIAVIFKVGAALVGFKLASLGARLGLNLLATGANGLTRTWLLLSSRGLVLRAMMLGQMGPLTGLLRLFGAGQATAVLWAGRLVRLGTILGGVLLRGLTLAGRAVLFLGRALLLNPIGLTITGIAVAGYLIYRHWDKIGPALGKAWAVVKGTFFGAWNWIKGLPASFKALGAELVAGLVGGLMSRIGAVRDKTVGLGQSIKAWFADTLGIRSPSRVFMGFGANIGEGAELGILGRVARVKGAAAKMAGAAVAGAALAGGAAAAGTGAPGRAGGITVHFSPQITVQAGAGTAVDQQVQAALRMSQRELETMLRKVLADQQRRSF